MKKLLLMLLCLPLIGFGQGWINYYNDVAETGGVTIRQTTDLGYLILGDNIIKTNNNGDTLWKLDYPASDGFQTIDGGYIACEYWGYGSFVRFDAQGDTLWTKNYKGASIVDANDGGFVFINSSISGNPFRNEQFNTKSDKSSKQINLFKIDSLGSLLWSKTYFPYQLYTSNAAYSLIKTYDDGYMIFGNHPLGYSYFAGHLIKTDMNGDTLWTKGYNFGSVSQGIQTIDSGYIFTGNVDTADVNNSVYLLKTNSLGGQEFVKTFQHPNPSVYDEIYPSSVNQTNDGGYIMTLTIKEASYGWGKIYVIKTNSLGDTLWTNTFCNVNCGMMYRGANNIQQTADGGYILTGVYWDGSFNSSNEPDENGMSTIVIKINHLGNLTSTQHISLSNNNGELLKVTDLLGRETKQTNQPLFYIYNDGTVEKRIIIE